MITPLQAWYICLIGLALAAGLIAGVIALEWAYEHTLRLVRKLTVRDVLEFLGSCVIGLIGSVFLYLIFAPLQ